MDLDPVPIGLVRIYAIIAVLLIVIPEWLAELIIALRNSTNTNKLTTSSHRWETIPELKVSTMHLSELRLLAMKLNIQGYSSDAKNDLSKRVLRRLNRKISKNRRRGLFFE
ncbi:Hypothetical protein P9211_06861 [Prochlorococcus marinus str. MIT 9211]|uniref:Rho termination factor N-terminal domain-containing protein n=2 Tax=Prochlorococcus marinus TaxID=1219 RepID=A9B9V5_PROM4|nr:Hypothetical protein P9211_06861 [Prochlorococcus marinus str. MIT 9211]